MSRFSEVMWSPVLGIFVDVSSQWAGPAFPVI